MARWGKSPSLASAGRRTSAYQGSLARLRDLQRRFDPDGVFAAAVGSTRVGA
jgi:hypothetical protein